MGRVSVKLEPFVTQRGYLYRCRGIYLSLKTLRQSILDTTEMSSDSYEDSIIFPQGHRLEYELSCRLDPGCTATREVDVDLWALRTIDGAGVAAVGGRSASLAQGKNHILAAEGALTITAGAGGDPLLLTIYGFLKAADARE